MKPAPFRYFAPHSVDEALELLAEHGDEAKVLAGGQSLVPAMSFRLAQPAVLVDLGRIAELSYIRGEAVGPLRIGAMTRQRAAERSGEVALRAPLLHQAMPLIAHPQIRNRGTVGGSLAHADPAAELPAVALVLDAGFLVRRRGGERRVRARDFYTGLFATALEAGEMLVEIEVPAAGPRTGWAVQEISRRHGDFALAGVAAAVTMAADGRCEGAEIAFFGVGEGPTLVEDGGAALLGRALTDGGLDGAALEEAARHAVRDLDPPSDIHASAAFRRHLARVLAGRCLASAARAAWLSTG